MIIRLLTINNPVMAALDSINLDPVFAAIEKHE